MANKQLSTKKAIHPPKVKPTKKTEPYRFAAGDRVMGDRGVCYQITKTERWKQMKPRRTFDKESEAQEVKETVPGMTDDDLRTAAFVVNEELNQRRRCLAAIKAEQASRRLKGAKP